MKIITDFEARRVQKVETSMKYVGRCMMLIILPQTTMTNMETKTDTERNGEAKNRTMKNTPRKSGESIPSQKSSRSRWLKT